MQEFSMCLYAEVEGNLRKLYENVFKIHLAAADGHIHENIQNGSKVFVDFA